MHVFLCMQLIWRLFRKRAVCPWVLVKKPFFLFFVHLARNEKENIKNTRRCRKVENGNHPHPIDIHERKGEGKRNLFRATRIFKMQNQQQRNQDTRDMFALLDGVVMDPQQRNEMKNVLGLVNRYETLMDYQQIDNHLGIVSPLVRITSALNTNFAVGNPGNLGLALSVDQVPALGTIYTFNVIPFRRLLEIHEPLQVTVYTAAQMNANRGGLARLPEDLISQVTSIRGMECCTLDDCLSASNLVAAYVKFEDGEAQTWVGACVFCRSHRASLQGPGPLVLLPRRSHRYLLNESWQEQMRQI
jgi:hypothetical protein